MGVPSTQPCQVQASWVVLYGQLLLKEKEERKKWSLVYRLFCMIMQIIMSGLFTITTLKDTGKRKFSPSAELQTEVLLFEVIFVLLCLNIKITRGQIYINLWEVISGLATW